MERSSLNSDLYRKHIVPNPSCRCGGFESRTCNHFFFAGPLYSLDRQLTNNVRLFGCEIQTEDFNELFSIFFYIQEFEQCLEGLVESQS